MIIKSNDIDDLFNTWSEIKNRPLQKAKAIVDEDIITAEGNWR